MPISHRNPNGKNPNQNPRFRSLLISISTISIVILLIISSLLYSCIPILQPQRFSPKRIDRNEKRKKTRGRDREVEGEEILVLGGSDRLPWKALRFLRGVGACKARLPISSLPSPGMEVAVTGSLAEGLGAALMAECKMRRRKGIFVLMWRGDGGSQLRVSLNPNKIRLKYYGKLSNPPIVRRHLLLECRF